MLGNDKRIAIHALENAAYEVASLDRKELARWQLIYKALQSLH